MYYLLRIDGSLKLIDGELINGVICKKAGSFFKRKWIPILAEATLREIGLWESANTLLNSGDTLALLIDPRMASGVYRLGANVEGTVIGDDQFPTLLGTWLRESGMGAKIEKNLPQVLPKAKEYIFSMLLYRFGEEARRCLRDGDPELTLEQFDKAMMRALEKAHVKT